MNGFDGVQALHFQPAPCPMREEIAVNEAGPRLSDKPAPVPVNGTVGLTAQQVVPQ